MTGLRIALPAIVTAPGVTALFSALEIVAMGEPATPAEVLLDVAETLILVGAIFAGVSLLPRIRALESEAALLRRDVRAATEDGAAWVAQIRSRSRSRRSFATGT